MVFSFNVNDNDYELLKYLSSIGLNERSSEIRRALRTYVKLQEGGAKVIKFNKVNQEVNKSNE